MTAAGKNLISGNGSEKVYIILGLGQSLAAGYTSATAAALSSAAGYNTTLGFKGGTRLVRGEPALTSTITADDISELVRSHATIDTGGYSQTLDDSLVYRLYSDHAIRAVTMVSAVGGMPYSSLKKGTQPYAVAIQGVTQAVKFLHQLGYEVEVMVTWQHGESEVSATRATYKAEQIELHDDLLADISPLTGQSELHIFAAQSPSLSQSQVPLAQWDLSREKDYFHVVGPAYNIPLSDPQHPTPAGYYYLGEVYARAIATVIAGDTWKPFQPSSVSLAGSTLTVVMEGMTGDPTINTSLVTNIGDGKGFEFYDDSGSPPSVTDVTATSTGYTITLSAAPTGTAGSQVLRTAYTSPEASGSGPEPSVPGARTNLCDQDTLTSEYDETALPNWCVLSEIAIS